MDLNIDQQTLEACLKTISNIGSTTYQNICTGETTTVPWGAENWIVSLFVYGLLALIVLAVIVVICGIVTDY